MISTIALAGGLLADWHHGWGWHWLLAPLFWLLVVVAVIWLVRGGPWRRRRWGSHRETAVEALERRFAQGEIEPEEYQRRRSILNESKRE
jgi:putative membrane protein